MDTKNLADLSFTAVKSKTKLPKPLTYIVLDPIQEETQLHICSCLSLKDGRSSGLVPVKSDLRDEPSPSISHCYSCHKQCSLP